MYQVFTGLGEIALFAYFLPLTKNLVFSKTVSKALCIKSFPVIDHSPYFLTFSPLMKNHVFEKISSKALCIKCLWVWNFTGGWIFFLFFFHKAFFKFHKKCLFSHYMSRVCEFGILLEVASFLCLLPLTKNQVFRKSVIKPFTYQELGGLGFLGLNPNKR